MTTRAPNAFWRFSLRVYRACGVQEACLALQEQRGADVNLLLFCGWLGQGGRALTLPLLRQAMASVGAWQSEVIAPVRQARRALKQRSAAGSPTSFGPALRKRILALELNLEYVEQCLLVELAARWPLPGRTLTPRQAVARSLGRYLALLPTPAQPTDSAHVATLVESCGEVASRARPGGTAAA